MGSRVRILFLWSAIIFSLLGLGCCQSSQGIDPKKVSEIEEYLIDFSKKIEGHRPQTDSLPPDLDADKKAVPKVSSVTGGKVRIH
jgi:hypothetical protein